MTIRIEQEFNKLELEVENIKEAVEVFEVIMSHCKVETTLVLSVSVAERTVVENA